LTRGQYIAMCMIGALALVAYLQSYEIARALKNSGALVYPQEFKI